MNKDPKTGKFLPGNNANPDGGRVSQKHWQPYGKRMAYWLDNNTVEQLMDLFADEKRMRSQSVIDAVVLDHIKNVLTGDDKRQERKDMLDRIEGQPKATVAIEGGDQGSNPVKSVVTVQDGAKIYAELMKGI